jgi:hypothetical protein
VRTLGDGHVHIWAHPPIPGTTACPSLAAPSAGLGSSAQPSLMRTLEWLGPYLGPSACTGYKGPSFPVQEYFWAQPVPQQHTFWPNILMYASSVSLPVLPWLTHWSIDYYPSLQMILHDVGPPVTTEDCLHGWPARPISGPSMAGPLVY